MRNLILALVIASGLFLGSAVLIGAAPNPSGTGQPSVQCGDPGAEVMPAGFESGGFAHAQTVYAGADESASRAHTDNSHVVSQYDVACFQNTSAGH